MSMKADRAEVEELVVDRHFKMKSPLGSINVHSSSSALGMWISPANRIGVAGQVGLFVQNGTANIAVWTKNSKTIPFAISENGLQVVTSSGQARIIPLDRIADMLVNLADAVEPQKPFVMKGCPGVDEKT